MQKEKVREVFLLESANLDKYEEENYKWMRKKREKEYSRQMKLNE